jgi:hypothetical protein
MDIKTLEAKVIYFERQVFKIAKNSKLLEEISKAQEDAQKACAKARDLYQEYINSN